MRVEASVFVVAAVFVGCGPSAVRPPQVDPDAATAEAIKKLDSDGDGALSESELADCPALRDASVEYDLDRDGKITHPEMLERLTAMYKSEVGLTEASCKVYFNRNPLVGAKVRYVPETFLGNDTKVAEGTTDETGYTALAIPDSELPEDLHGLGMMQVGLYRVEITHPEVTIPAKYNTETTLGFELHPANHEEPHSIWPLSPK